MYAQEISRTIIISSVIDEDLAREVVAHIMAINDHDMQVADGIASVGGQFIPEPIEMFINSGGGSVTDGFAIIDAMEMSDTPIVTYAMGSVGSMALAIYIAGDHRVATRHTRFMYHGVQYGMGGEIIDHKLRLEEVEVMQKMYDELVSERTNLPEEKRQYHRDMKREFYFSAKEAQELGVAHEITVKPEPKFEFKKAVEEGEIATEGELDMETMEALVKALESMQEISEIQEEAKETCTKKVQEGTKKGKRRATKRLK